MISSSYGQMSRLMDVSTRSMDRFNEVQKQIATGKKSDTFGGYAPVARTVINLRNEISRRESYMDSINVAQPRLVSSQTALGRMGTIMSDIQKTALTGAGTGPKDAALIRQQAQSALKEMTSLLNTKSDGQYVFAGSDSSNAPISSNDLMSGTPSLFTDISTRLSQLDGTPGNTLDDVMADLNTLSMDDTGGRSIFSASLSAPRPAGTQDEAPRSIVADDGQRITVAAKSISYKDPAAPADSTGSWTRDMMRDLMMLASASDELLNSDDGAKMMGRVSANMDRNMVSLNRTTADLAMSQRSLDALSDKHADMRVALKSQSSNVEDIDYTDAAARLKILETQLQSSWTILSKMGSMSLANFLR